jgi:hypothetical protein
VYAKDNDLLRYFGRLGKAWNLPGRIVDWESADVASAWAEYLRKFNPTSNPARNGRPAAAAR